jgi:phospholipase C
MMSGRSFDHMLGSLKTVNPLIDGLDGTQWNPDPQGNQVFVQPLADFQGQLIPSPEHDFPGVDLQIFGDDQSETRVANMQGFVKSYYRRQPDLAHSQKVMYYFTEDKLPVLTSLATNFAVFNRWFASVPGHSVSNRVFAHHGTSFGQVGANVVAPQGKSIFERLLDAGHTAKFYYFDQASQVIEAVDLMKRRPQLFGTFEQFITNCNSGNLSDYSFIEPNYTYHDVDSGLLLASDQRADHNVQTGEVYIASVYNAIRNNPHLWPNTALLVVYDEHGGIFDHVPPPACSPDGYTAGPKETGLNYTFNFDRLGVRVPAILISPWVPRGTVVGTDRVFEHASIPATVTSHFIGNYTGRTLREENAQTFLDLLSLETMRTDALVFNSGGPPLSEPAGAKARSIAPPGPTDNAVAENPSRPKRKPKGAVAVTTVRVPFPSAGRSRPQPFLPTYPAGPSTHVARDRWTTNDSLGHYPYAYAIYRFLTDPETSPPLAVSIQAPWGGGKTSLMRMIQAQLDPDAIEQVDQTRAKDANDTARASVKQVLAEIGAAADPPEGVVSATVSMKPHKFHFFSKSNASKVAQPSIPIIEKPGERRVTVWFNAWKYESTSQVWAGLADCVVRQVGKRLGPVERELFWLKLQLRRLDARRIRSRIHQEIFSAFAGKLLSWSPIYVGALVVVGFAMLKQSWLYAGGLFAVEFAAAGLQFLKARSETEKQPARISLGDFVQAPDYAANLGFVHEVSEDLRRVFQLVPKKHLPMVVFIDDLDRCSPGKIAAVVEAINLFLAGEFPDCMFVLGIDDEMVAAALDMAHSDVIAKLPKYAKSTSIGWRFMDKFVQLPFVIPPPALEDLVRYVKSLLSQGGARIEISMQARDTAARVIEASTPSSRTPDQVVGQVSSEQPLAPEQQQALKKEVEIIQGMNENIKEFTDQEKGIRDAIAEHAQRYFSNPRDIKRFVNLFRFYYFLRAAHEASLHLVPSIDQLARWLALSLKWPEVARWLRSQPAPQDGSSDSPMKTLERLGGASKTITEWQDGMEKAFGIGPEQAGWLADEDLHAFLHREISDFKKMDRLSSCSGMGLW